METRAVQLVKGILFLVVSYITAQLFDLKAVGLLLNNVFNLGIIAIIVLFQPEIRRILEKMGTQVKSFSLFNASEVEAYRQKFLTAIDHISKAADILSKNMTGGIIVIERDIKLGEEITTGIMINADVSTELICNIFVNKAQAPLHDGALVIRDSRILAAACYLPRPSKEEYIAHELGSRHRAAIGISENSDSLTVVISEETGIISIAENGVLSRGFNKSTLHNYLRTNLLPPEEEKSNKKSQKRKKDKV